MVSESKRLNSEFELHTIENSYADFITVFSLAT